jgi:hypothetical protein
VEYIASSKEQAMNDLNTTIDIYLDAYGETDGARRRALIAAAWAADGQLVDPPLDARGHDGIDEMFVAVQSQFPAQRFRRSTEVDAHHGYARYGWELVALDGSVTLSGIDIARLDGSGKLMCVTGFFGELPALVA